MSKTHSNKEDNIMEDLNTVQNNEHPPFPVARRRLIF